MIRKRAAYLACGGTDVKGGPEDSAEWVVTARIDHYRFAELSKMATQGEVDVVVVDSLVELLTRDLKRGVQLLARLNADGVAIHALREPEIDTEGPTGRGLNAFLEAVELARKQRLKRNIAAGQKRAERSGKRLGRPTKTRDNGAIRQLAKAGKTVREIAAELGISKSTVQRTLAAIKR